MITTIIAVDLGAVFGLIEVKPLGKHEKHSQRFRVYFIQYIRLARLHSLLESELLLCSECLHWTSFHRWFKHCCNRYAQTFGTFHQPYAESLFTCDRYSI